MTLYAFLSLFLGVLFTVAFAIGVWVIVDAYRDIRRMEEEFKRRG